MEHLYILTNGGGNFSNFMTILITGANGFLGNILKQSLEGNILTLGRNNSDYNIDLRHDIPKIKNKIDCVIHCLGKAHVSSKTIKEKDDFYKVNVDGTKNLLLGINNLPQTSKPTNFIFISSVAVYGITEGENIKEDFPLNAIDAYGHSKVLAEKEIINWGKENKIIITILRLPLIVGEFPKGNLKKMIDGISLGYYFAIGARNQRKSMLLGKDIVSIIPKKIGNGGIYNLTDDYNPTLKEIEEAIMKKYNKKRLLVLPYVIAWFLSKIGDLINIVFRKQIIPMNSLTLKKITSTLTFSCEKAKKEIGWVPKKAIDYL